MSSAVKKTTKATPTTTTTTTKKRKVAVATEEQPAPEPAPATTTKKARVTKKKQEVVEVAAAPPPEPEPVDAGEGDASPTTSRASYPLQKSSVQTLLKKTNCSLSAPCWALLQTFTQELVNVIPSGETKFTLAEDQEGVRSVKAWTDVYFKQRGLTPGQRQLARRNLDGLVTRVLLCAAKSARGKDANEKSKASRKMIYPHHIEHQCSLVGVFF